MQTINSVLLIASHASYIEDARRVFALIDRVRRQTVRSWHVYYLQNSRSNDVTYVLQQAFTPGHVTAVPTPSGQAPGASSSQNRGMGGGSGLSGSGLSGRGGGQGGLGSGDGLGGGGLTSSPAAAPGGGAVNQAGGDCQDQGETAAGNPLLGGLGGQLEPTILGRVLAHDAHHPE